MTDVTAERNLLQEEECRSNAAVSEATMTRFAAMANFLALREFTQHDFNLNGKYNMVTIPNLNVDGYVTYPFAWEIIDILLITGSANGSSGTTEIDLKWKPEASGSFATIFSTTPKFTSSAGAGAVARIGQAAANMTAPVLSKTQFDAYDIVKLDILQAVAGTVNGCFIKLFIRPR